MRSLTARPTEQQPMGYFRIFARPPGGARREITLFRDAPAMVSSVSWSDPFSDQTAQISFPQITVFDQLGTGDLDWCVCDADIDIVWQNVSDYGLEWAWEGYIAAFNFSLEGTENNFTIDLKGCLYGMDDYLAIPSFPKRPIPYEILMAMAFDQREHPANLGQFRVLFPEDWSNRVPEFTDPAYLSVLKPWGVTTGQLWTGLTSRSTGSWEPLLTGFVQTMLTVMFAEGGAQWSIRNRGNRSPELFLRQIPDDIDESIVDIVVGSPGVSLSASKDYSQRATVIYGQGNDEAGINYSNMQVAPDGSTTFFKPFAYSPRVWPRQANPNYDSNVKPKETFIRFTDGVDAVAAAQIAQGQYHRFAEPGITGTITLTTDQRYADGCLAPRMLMKAGHTLRLKGLFGIPEGVLVHVTQVQSDFSTLTTSLTFDSKYRDQLTVAEVKARTRDALTPIRTLQVGKFSNIIQDLVLPWSYAEGSGCIPLESKEFFNAKLPPTATFPYEEWTTKYPPKDPASKAYYIRIGPTNTTDSGKNWSGVVRNGTHVMSIPFRMAQAGSIKLSQIAAYDKDGHVMPVRFHVSVFSNNGTADVAMPKFNEDPDVAPVTKFLHPTGITVNYGSGQANPFFENAWEAVRADGTPFENTTDVLAGDAGLVIGWGNYYEPAGYSPGRYSRGASRTGMLEDTSPWSWDISNLLDLQNPQNNTAENYAGMLFIQIFCDEQGTEPVFFLGKFWKQEAGTQ